MENNAKRFSPRYQSRELALKVIFSYSQNNKTGIKENFEYMKENFFPKLKKTDLADSILDIFTKKNDEIDEIVKKFANKWDYKKQNPIDIVILKMLIIEFIFLGTPDKVAVSEYINLTVNYSKESSVKFINGVAGQIIKNYGKENEKAGKKS